MKRGRGLPFPRFAGLATALALCCAGILLRKTAPFVGTEGGRKIWRKADNANRDHPSPGFAFTDVTDRLGISFNWQEPVMDPLLSGKVRYYFYAPGVAVADFDGDGYMDILLVNSARNSRNHLYLNQKGAGFQERAEEWAIADTNAEGATVSPVVIDFDRDGRPDVYLSRMGCSMLFRNTGHGFEDVTKSSGIGDCRNSLSAIPLDYDHDGNLDLLILRYWRPLDPFHLDSPFLFAENYYDARNGGGLTLFRNRGDGTFEDVTASVIGDAPHRWSMDAMAADFTGTGRTDLYVADDFGPDLLYRLDREKFVDESLRLGVPDRRQGMGVSLGDLDGDGKPHVFVSNIWSQSFQLTGNFLWKFGPDGQARDESTARSVNCLWSWGSAFADFGLHGHQDIYVANGFVSGSGPGDFAFRGFSIEAGMGAWVTDVRNWPDLKSQSFIGHQTDCVLLNHGDHFDDVAEDVGITKDWDGRAVGLIDYDNNGSLDLIVTTENGPPHLLKNTVEPGDHWIGFSLEGTRSNREAAGARIEVRQGDKKWYRWGTAGRTGLMASSDPRFHFGIPEGGEVDVTVRWPSGKEQELKKLKTGRYYPIREEAAP